MQIIRNVEPQPGFQWSVITCSADVLIMGGSAGCGKSWCLLFEPVRNLQVKGFAGIIFRREMKQVSNPGGLFEKAVELYTSLPYPYIASVHQKPPLFRFPAGSSVAMGHLNQTMDVLSYQGAEIAYIAFDELTHFEEYQFFYMLSRNRSTCGVRPLVRASTNPQGSGWVKELIQWWLYPDDYPDESVRGLPIKERAGVIRYFVRIDSITIWGDTREEVWNQLPDDSKAKLPVEAVKSFTFIGGKLADNPVLTKKDPGYIGNLMAQSEIDRVQLMDGRWSDPSVDSRRLYDDAEIIDFLTNDFVKGNGKRYMTADVALEGADRFTVGIWDGWVLEKVFISEKTDPEEVRPWLEKIARENRVPRSHIAFDATGIGAMLKGFLINARPVSGAASPLQPLEEIGRGDNKAKKTQYLNLRVQLHYKFKEILANRLAYCAVKDVDLQRTITAELKAVKKGETKEDDKLRLISNDEMKLTLKGKSPDIAVMIIQRSIFELKPADKKAFKRQIRAL